MFIFRGGMVLGLLLVSFAAGGVVGDAEEDFSLGLQSNTSYDENSDDLMEIRAGPPNVNRKYMNSNSSCCTF